MTAEHPLRAKFLHQYANIPLGLRGEIIGVHPEYGTFTWSVAYMEVEQRTPVSEWMLDYLHRLDLV